MKLIKFGGALTLIGLVVFLFLAYIIKPYAGNSGAGMAGLPVALALIAAILIMLIGILMVIVGFILS